MPSYLATSNNDAIKTAEQVLLDGTQTIAGVEDVLVDGQSVVRDNVAHIDLSGKQDKLTVTQDLTLSGAELGVNKEKIQEKLSAGNNIEIIDNVISAKAVQPNIDSIAVNGTALIPDENKQVNIIIDKATIDLANVDNTSDINKPVSTAQQNAIDAVQNNLDDETTRAKAAEASLLSAVTDETTRAKKVEGELDGKITAETNRASEMETSLQTKLNAEIADRKSGDTGLSTRIDNEVTRAQAAEGENASAVNGIKALIPNQASSTNQLADKDFVNSSVNAVAATFRGNFATKAALDAWQVANPNVAKKNDYAIVQQDETHSNQQWRYLYQDDGWDAQYKVNDAPFTEAQNKAINSGATKDIIDSVANKLNKSDVLNASGSATDKPISQNAATQAAQNVQSNLEAHINNNNNPHRVTAAQVGLGNVENTSDADKPISTAQQTALDAKLDKVTTTTAAKQVYAKNADGTQGMTNVGGTADDDIATVKQMNGAIATAVEAGVSGCERTDNKVTAVTGTGSDVQYPSTKAVVDYVSSTGPYHITISDYTGTITQEQYDKLKADNNSYIYIKKADAIAIKVINWTSGLYYNAAVGVRQYEMYVKTDLEYTVNLIDLERQDNKQSVITGTGNDIQYPSTKAVIDYVAEHSGKAYHVELTGDSGTITTEQYNALLADNDSYVLHTVGVAVMRLARAVKVEGAQTGSLQYQKFIGGIARTITIQASGAWEKTETTYQPTSDKTTSISDKSTDNEYPSAKAVYAYSQTIQTNAQTYATTAETNAKAYADSLIGNVNEWLTKIDSGEGV